MALRTVRRLWRVRHIYATVAEPSRVVPAIAMVFLRFMYGAIRDGEFTEEKEAEGRRRWVAVYDAGVKVLRALPFVKR